MKYHSLRCVVCFLPAIISHARAEAIDFKGPFGVGINSRDIIYIAEIDNARVSKLSTEGKRLGFIQSIPGYGPLKGPFDVAIGPNDRIHIADTQNHQVVVLDHDEKFLFKLGIGKKGAAKGMFGEPHFVAVNRAGEIFVSDTFNARIQKFSPEGKFIKAWGRVGEAPGEFRLNGYLGGITLDNKGHVFVRETDGGRIQKYTEDGKHVKTFSRRGTGPGELDEGYGAVVVGDTFYAVDTFESRIQRFSLDGKFLDMWDPGEGNDGHKFNHPVDLHPTSNGNLIVTDWKNDRVLKLDSSGKFLATWGHGGEALLAYKPPHRRRRASDHRVKIGIYASVTDKTIEAAKKFNVDIIYPSFDGQDGAWGIAAAVSKAKALGIQVHPSIACQYFGQTSEFSRSHPEFHIWKMGAEKPVGGLLSWAHAETRSFRADHLVEQARKTGVQGIMLDYIRYFGTDYGYDPIIVKRYKEKYGIDPNTLPQTDPQWMQFRADYVTEFIVELRHKLADLDHHVELSIYGSGAGGSPKNSMLSAMQDWGRWARMGIIDRIHVAHYTRDMERIYNAVRDVRSHIPDRVILNCFVACYGGNLNTPEFLKKGIDVAIAAGADEVTIYRGDAIWELNMWDAIREAAEDANRGR